MDIRIARWMWREGIKWNEETFVGSDGTAVHFECSYRKSALHAGKSGFQHQTMGRLASGQDALHRLRAPLS